MGEVFTDADELGAVLRDVFAEFLASEDGERVAKAAADLPGGGVLELRFADPDLAVWVEFAGRRLVDAPAEPPTAVAAIEADALHHLLMDQLGPVEISRLAEERRVALEGPPLVLGALLPVVAAIQPYYRRTIESDEWSYLLDAPQPVVGEIWESSAPPPSVIGVRRPWQRPRRSKTAVAQP